jgi:hypothetical protein
LFFSVLQQEILMSKVLELQNKAANGCSFAAVENITATISSTIASTIEEKLGRK